MAIRTPNLDSLSVSTSVSNFPAAGNFNPRPGALYLFNGGASDCWITLDGSVPTASDGTGRIRLESNQGFDIEDAEIVRLRAITASGTTVIQIVYIERPTATSSSF